MKPSGVSGPAVTSPDGAVVSQVLDGSVYAPAAARATVRAACRSWQVGIVLAETLALVVSELVTNVVRAEGRRLSLRLMLRCRTVRVEVEDSQPGTPEVRRPDADAESGRGLWLVESVATRFGVDRTATGKVLWAEFGR